MLKPDVEPLEKRIFFNAPTGPAGPGVDGSVAARYVFYNQSVFDGFDPSANPADDSAIAYDKTPLLPGQTASAANHTGYWHGINGLMVDVAGLASAPSAEDFVFRVGNDPDAATWAPAPHPASITVRPAAGVDGADRVTLVWPDGAIRNQWLQVTLLETSRTNLPAPDVFYVGNLVADTGDAPAGGEAVVDNRDLLRTRMDRTRRATASPANRSDHNRDGRINARDLLLVRRNRTLPGRGSPLSLITAPVEPPVYYVSPDGDDANDGLSPLRPWRSAAKVNATQVTPGSRVLFERGGQWREQLRPSSSGTPANPVVFGSYGAGMRPKFWGSDVLEPARFEPVQGEPSVYRYTPPAGMIINSVQANGAMFRSGVMATARGGVAGTPEEARAFVTANASSWMQDAAGTLFVNTGGDDPRTGAVTYTGSVRDNVVYLSGLHDVRMRNLVVDESAKFGGGFAFTVEMSDNVVLEDSEAYRAAKHHIGVLNSRNFVGRRLYAAWAMPDQGQGGATTYVSFSDPRVPQTVATWADVTSDLDPSQPYLGFYSHGAGMGELIVHNLVSRGGGGVGLSTEAAGVRVRITGGLIENGWLMLYGNNIAADGITLRGPGSGMAFIGNGNVVQNTVIDGALPDYGHYSAVVDEGRNNTLRFSTVRLDPASPTHTGAVTIVRPFANTTLYGNIFDAPVGTRLWDVQGATFSSDRNLFAQPPRFIEGQTWVDLEQWRALGREVNSLVADPQFVDEANGNLRLRLGSPAIDALPGPALGILTDFDGRPRPQGAGYDLGAFESELPPRPPAPTFVGAAPALAVAERSPVANQGRRR